MKTLCYYSVLFQKLIKLMEEIISKLMCNEKCGGAALVQSVLHTYDEVELNELLN